MDDAVCPTETDNVQNKQKATTPKRTQRRGGKQQLDRPERALFCLTLKNPLRIFCIKIVDSKYPLTKTESNSK